MTTSKDFETSTQTAPLPVVGSGLRWLLPWFYACEDSDTLKPMHRLIARLLLLFALAGNFAPVALALTAGPSASHACCVRKAHKCHTIAVPESEQLTLHALSCCEHDCCRAVATSQWASPQALAAADFTPAIDRNVASIGVIAPVTIAPTSPSTRAPPVF
jgi:hypothetical protein